MKHENIVLKLERLVKEADALSQGKDAVEIDEDPRICALMMEAEPIIEEIDFILNNAFPGHPEKVALWKQRMGIEDEERDED